MPQTLTRPGDQFLEESVNVAIDVAEEREVKRINRHRSAAVSPRVEERVVLQDEQAREVNVIERGERNQRVVGIHLTRPGVHGIEQRAQFAFLGRIDRRQDSEVCLRGHDAELENFVAGRLVTRHGIHVVAKF